MTERTRADVRVTGVVQAVGFRPFVHRTAAEAGVGGYVRNTGDGVDAAFEGPREAVESVLDAVRADAPPLARVEDVEVEWTDPDGIEDFDIRDSTGSPNERAGERSGAAGVAVPPDTGICDRCLDDVRDPDSRYHGYWATACVDCGPRFTVVRGVPYDRARTAMDAFPMCEGCRERYESPTDRRYHAQTVACPECGPTLRYETDGRTVARRRDAVRRAAERLAAGEILAVKGVGGTHLVCDATDPATVERLRDRTRRPAKPFAVMVQSLAAAREFATVGDEEAAALTDVRRPIALLEAGHADAEPPPWLDAVAPGLHTVGVMLPYAGLHHLLFDGVDGPLVMTSANLPGRPMVTTVEGIRERLDGVVDGALVHDREVVARCDDSVVRVVDGSRRFLRRSRGWTPVGLPNPAGGEDAPSVLAVGPERDATVAVSDGHEVVPSQHVGDVTGPDALGFHRDAVERLTDLTGVEPSVVACDSHPAFLTTEAADRYADEGLSGPVAVQHHHAHAAGLCAEHGVERAVVVTADGTGYGPDGTVWGGEVLDATYGDFERVGGLDTFPLPGGEAAVEYPARALAGLLDDSDRVDDRLVTTGAVADRSEAAVVREQAASGVNAPATTSAGRLLDAVAALVGTCDRRRYEGEPAQRLEALARRGSVRDVAVRYATREGRRVVDVRRLVADLDALGATAPSADVAATAQDALARGLADLAVEAASDRGLDCVGFTGGVAYNDAISRRVRNRVEAAGLRFLGPDRVPPGDGGVAYGQAVVATARR
ncbi:carbamoyltransferase HypF [Halorussus halobius]|uniref:carbamoyltransferase HypF n=1 Tax=Halorussus halobius TaxID=1710537 RepID=UPI0010920A8E|nr:carbamoyltransferase HypF [Halorussus halobius]